MVLVVLFTLGTLYNHTLRMPCINVQGVIGMLFMA